MSLKSSPSSSVQLHPPSSTFWNTGPYLLWAQHQSWSQSPFELHPSLIITNISSHHWHRQSNSNLCSGMTLTNRKKDGLSQYSASIVHLTQGVFQSSRPLMSIFSIRHTPYLQGKGQHGPQLVQGQVIETWGVPCSVTVKVVDLIDSDG